MTRPLLPGRNYARGARFERIVADALRRDGYRLVRAAGSHGKADLVALKPRHVVLVQCKLSGPGAVRPVEWNELYELAQYAQALAVIAHRPARGRIAYARMVGRKDRPGARAPVVLWTPDELSEGS